MTVSDPGQHSPCWGSCPLTVPVAEIRERPKAVRRGDPLLSRGCASRQFGVSAGGRRFSESVGRAEGKVSPALV